MKKVLVIVAALALIVGAVIGVGAYFIIQSLSHPPEDTSKFLPLETTFYVSINLRPGPGQSTKAKEILDRFKKNPKFEEKLDELYDSIEEESGIDVEEELYPWLGPEIAFAVVDFSDIDEIPAFVAFVGTTDYDASESLVRKLIALDESEGGEYEETEVKGYVTFVIEPYGETTYITLTNDYVVVAGERELLESTLDRMDSGGDRQPSLFDKPGFQEARDAAQSPRFGITYVDIAGIIEQLGDETDEEFEEFLEFFGDNLPDFIVVSSAFLDKGIRVSTSFDAPNDWFTIGSENSLESAGLAPEDAVGLVSFVGTANAWNKIKEELDESGSYDVDEFLDEIEAEIGIDVEEDIFSWMTGELAFAMHIPSGVSFGLDQIHANVYVEFDDRAKALSSMEKIRASMEESGVEFTDIEVEGTDAVIMDLGDDQGDLDLSPGYIVMDDYVVIGTTVKSLRQTVETVRGDIPSLRESSAFNRPLAAAGDSTDFMIYGNIKRIMEAALDQLDETELEEYGDEAAPFLDPLEAFLVGASFDEGLFTFSAVLTVE